MVNDQAFALQTVLADPLSTGHDFSVNWLQCLRHQFIMVIYCENSKSQSAVQ